VLTFIGAVIASVVGMFIFRYILRTKTFPDNANASKIIGGICNSVQIQIFNQVYGKVVFALNEYENHRTDTEYENALIAKSFMFKFVNSYNSLFYIAFFMENWDPTACKDISEAGDWSEVSCMDNLQMQLGIVFGSLIVINNTLEVLLPYIKGEMKAKAESKGIDTDKAANKSFPEDEYEMQQYESTFDDYDELAIQFGFVVLFVVAFPLTPLLAFLNNILEVKVDSTKLIQVTRRPEPRGVYSIGTFYDIYSIMAYVCIVTNIILVIFYTEEIESWVESSGTTVSAYEAKAWAAIIAEHFVVILKFAIEYFIPDESVYVTQHKSRQEYLVNILLKGAEEEDDDDQLVTVDEQAMASHSKAFAPADIPSKLVVDEHCFW